MAFFRLAVIFTAILVVAMGALYIAGTFDRGETPLQTAAVR